MLLCNFKKDNDRWQQDNKTTKTRSKDEVDNIQLEWALFQKYKSGFKDRAFKAKMALNLSC